jgi:hypothetical protein
MSVAVVAAIVRVLPGTRPDGAGASRVTIDSPFTAILDAVST